jgi:transcriptional regulator with XRE-family HTH domain
MEGFGERLRARARQLELPDAEVARRAGLSERRYGNYVAGIREPDLATLLRVCEALAVTPNDLLLPKAKSVRLTKRESLLARVTSALAAFPPRDLEVATVQMEAAARLLASERMV